MPVPNKTIYVSDGDLPLYQRAQELGGGNLSAAIAKALRRYVEAEEGLRAGFEQITVKVGIGSKRKVRFVGVLVGEWMDTTGSLVETFRVYRGRTGKYVLHVERSPEYWITDPDGKPAGWRGRASPEVRDDRPDHCSRRDPCAGVAQGLRHPGGARRHRP